MNRYIVFLRGINLGKRRVKMDTLRTLFEAMAFSEVSTFIASGNVIFATRLDDAAEVENLIERKLAQSLGYGVDAFVRSRDEVRTLAAAQPFPKKDLANPAHTVYVGLFKAPLDPASARRFEAIRTSVDAFRVIDRQYYWLCRIKMSDSKVWTLPQWKALKLPTSSMRNLRTLRTLAELYPPVKADPV